MTLKRERKKTPTTNPQGTPATTYTCSCRRCSESNCLRLHHYCYRATVTAAAAQRLFKKNIIRWNKLLQSTRQQAIIIIGKKTYTNKMCVNLFLEIKIIRLIRKKQQNSYFMCIQILIRIKYIEYNIILLWYNSKSPKRSRLHLPTDGVVVCEQCELVEHSGSAACL